MVLGRYGGGVPEAKLRVRDSRGDTRVIGVNFRGKSFALGCVRQGRRLVCDRLNLEFDRDPPLTRGG